MTSIFIQVAKYRFLLAASSSDVLATVNRIKEPEKDSPKKEMN